MRLTIEPGIIERLRNKAQDKYFASLVTKMESGLLEDLAEREDYTERQHWVILGLKHKLYVV